jgi:hypothetical protein
MIADLSCGEKEGSAGMAAMALLVAMIDLLNSDDMLNDDEVVDICRNAHALLPETGAAADGARQILSSMRLHRRPEPPHS